MTIAVVVFPGTNCEHDVVHALDLLGAEATLVWHRETDLSDFAGVVLPGGFAHGDYLRTGAIARFSPVMAEVERAAQIGTPILGICNGFQILCEAGILPGALVANRDLKFICRPIHVRVESTDSVLTNAATVGDVLRVPLNSYEGNYVVPAEQLIDREADHLSTGIADGLLGILEDFPEQPQAVFQTAAVFVKAAVSASRQKMHRYREVMTGIDVDDIETGFSGPQRGVNMPAPDRLDVRLVHHPRLDRVIAVNRPV